MAVSNLEKLVDDLRKILIAKKQTVSAAESVTSGMLQLAFSLGEGASLYFMGGITVYNIAQKNSHLNVDLSDAVATNCVSVEVSAQMAEACCEMFSSTWAIGITGYATEMPPHTDKGLYACYAIAMKGKTVKSGKLAASAGTARKVQEEYTNLVLKEFLKVLKK
ncbi:MAG: hypothetical protein EOO03_16855 [Chitinophagaceae bacterium]|nr:MAG: hypothetical protein EOO03_16855 [Chitinophagaceae bacterium]